MPLNQFRSRRLNSFARNLSTVHPIDTKKPQSYKNKTANAVKLVSKQANERFRSYIGNGTSNRLKISSKVLNMEQ